MLKRNSFGGGIALPNLVPARRRAAIMRPPAFPARDAGPNANVLQRQHRARLQSSARRPPPPSQSSRSPPRRLAAHRETVSAPRPAPPAIPNTEELSAMTRSFASNASQTRQDT